VRCPLQAGYLSRHRPWNCYTISVTLAIPMVDDAALRWAHGSHAATDVMGIMLGYINPQ
jgi:hypothetical protein